MVKVVYSHLSDLCLYPRGKGEDQPPQRARRGTVRVWGRDLDDAVPSVDADLGPRHEPRGVAGEEDDSAGEVLGISHL